MVLDFGCRVGHYSIPAALTVGPSGMVYALDKHQEPLDELVRKAQGFSISNVRTIRTSEDIDIPLASNTIDVVLLYDVLHYFAPPGRQKLYEEADRVLKTAGLLSVYPKHTLQDMPSKEFADVRVSDIEREIQIAGFESCGHLNATVSHDDSLEFGLLLNFKKTIAA
jgi:ubiquinone/menaquinone biosynthesis C-methylase UbiE